VRFVETGLDGAWIVELERHTDERGFFARAFCRSEFEAHAIPSDVVQANVSYNHRAGTLRGMHYQVPPATETKFIRCINGAIHDVIVDLRPDSPTYLQHVGVELSATNRRALYVPGLFAHGFVTLTDDAEVLYLVGEYYTPGHERGIRYDDPVLGIDWPHPVAVLSHKDAAWPDLDPATALD
jgi:dTDP-4-dehydrorhamnose 3,5-epimerase